MDDEIEVFLGGVLRDLGEGEFLGSRHCDRIGQNWRLCYWLEWDRQDWGVPTDEAKTGGFSIHKTDRVDRGLIRIDSVRWVNREWYGNFEIAAWGYYVSQEEHRMPGFSIPQDAQVA